MKAARIIVIVAACVVGLVGLLYYWLAPDCFVLRKKATRLSNFYFEAIETYCAGLGITASASLSVSKRGEWGKTLLFEYDPIYTIEMPTISKPADNRISVTIPAVSSVIARRDQWRGMHIEYKIGEIDYPAAVRRLDDRN